MYLNDLINQKLDYHKAQYFKWKHGLWFYSNKKEMTEEEFLKTVNRKTLDGFKRWEKTDEYANLLYLLMGQQSAKRIYELNEVFFEKAKKGNEKSAKMFLDLQKRIKEYEKVANVSFDSDEKDTDEYDELVTE